MNNLLIRPAKPTEVKTLQNLNDEIFIDNAQYDPDLRLDWAQSKDGGQAYFTQLVNDSQAICLIAELDGKAIGYIAAAHKEIDYRKSKYLEIENMGVSPAYQSLGIGSKLMKKCLELGKTQGYQKAFVNAYFQNAKAISFYKRSGFSEIDISLEKEIR